MNFTCNHFPRRAGDRLKAPPSSDLERRMKRGKVTNSVAGSSHVTLLQETESQLDEIAKRRRIANMLLCQPRTRKGEAELNRTSVGDDTSDPPTRLGFQRGARWRTLETCCVFTVTARNVTNWHVAMHGHLQLNKEHANKD